MPCSEEALKLDRMRELLRRLGNPQDGMPIVHVAGTKGKGSTAAMIAAVLSAAGYRTGLFTSPHLDRVEERIAIDGQPCSAEDLAELVELVRPAVEAMDRERRRRQPIRRTMARPTSRSSPPWRCATFARRRVDAAVLEVGLGGRLDSTNVCTPCVSIITSISFDHTKQLGDTLAAIAAEKAGIIKPGVPVVSGVDGRGAAGGDSPHRPAERLPAAGTGRRFRLRLSPAAHLERAALAGALRFSRLIIAGDQPSSPEICDPRVRAVSHRHLPIVALGLLGRHQAANAAVALAAVEELRHAGWTIPEAAVRRGLAEVAWPARVEVVARRPTVVLDAAHNAASIAALVEMLDESFSARRRC